jgi:hypothetical protein
MMNLIRLLDVSGLHVAVVMASAWLRGAEFT